MSMKGSARKLQRRFRREFHCSFILACKLAKLYNRSGVHGWSLEKKNIKYRTVPGCPCCGDSLIVQEDNGTDRVWFQGGSLK